MMKIRTILALVLITALATALRLACLDRESLWLDEVGRVAIAMAPLSDIPHRVAVIELSPPLYQFLLHGWIVVFGGSDFSVRLFSALLGVLAVPLSYLVGQALYGWRVGLSSAGLAAVSPFYIYYAQEAAPYALLLVLTLLSVWFFLRLLRVGDGLAWSGYLSATALSLYTHTYAAFTLLAENFFLAAMLLWRGRYKELLGQWAVAQIGLGLLYLPWVPILMRQAALAANMVEWGRASLTQVITDLFLLFNVGFAQVVSWTVIFLAFVPVSLVGLLALGREPADLILSASLVLTPILAVVATSTLFHSYRERGFLVMAFVYYLALARGLAALLPSESETGLRRSGSLMLLAACVPLMLFSWANSLEAHYRLPQKEGWREAARYVEAGSREGDVILFFIYGVQVPFDHYYRGDLERHGLPQDFNWREGYCQRYLFQAEDIENSLEPRLAGHRRAWLVLSHDWGRGSELILAHMSVHHRLVERREFVGLQLFLYDLTGSPRCHDERSRSHQPIASFDPDPRDRSSQAWEGSQLGKQ
jgi:mannosyltransferase